MGAQGSVNQALVAATRLTGVITGNLDKLVVRTLSSGKRGTAGATP